MLHHWLEHFVLEILQKNQELLIDFSDTMQNALINIVTIFLGLGVGSKLASEQFLVAETMGIMAIGLLAFGAGTAMGCYNG